MISLVARQLTVKPFDEKRGWVVIDLGCTVIPSMYTLRYSKGYSKTAPRNWSFLMSKTGGSNTADWDVLYTHSNDESLKEHGSTASWSFVESLAVVKELTNEQESKGWRFARIQQTGRNQSGSSYSLSLCGFEIYGTVTSIVLSELTSCTISSSATRLQGSASSESSSEKRRQRRLMQSQNKLLILQKQMVLGARVVRGTDWKWPDQDKPCDDQMESHEGTIIGELSNEGWVECLCDNGLANFYRMGNEGKYALHNFI